MITFSTEILFGLVCSLLASLFIFYNHIFRHFKMASRLFISSLGVWMIWLGVIIGILIKEIW